MYTGKAASGVLLFGNESGAVTFCQPIPLSDFWIGPPWSPSI
jgi:hypothetical protein